MPHIGQTRGMDLPVMPPVKPMLAKSVARIPPGMQYEAKWDGFRALVFRDGPELELGSRTGKTLTRYFPELVAALLERLPERCVVDGEIVMARDGRLDFELLSERIHPAASRVRMLAERNPASFVAFDLLALGDEDLTTRPLTARRALLEEELGEAAPPLHVAPATRDPELAERWFDQFEGAGLDGVVAKPLNLGYRPNERVMYKIKHGRTADCVVAYYRTHRGGTGVGSLLLGLYDDAGTLQHVGVCAAFTAHAAHRADRRTGAAAAGVGGRPPVGGVGRGGRPRGGPAARRAEPLVGHEGPVVGTAAPGTRLRGRVRPHGGHPLPPHHPVQTLAPGPYPGELHVRAARGAGPVRPGRGTR